MNQLYSALGYSYWSWDSERIFGIYGSHSYIWTYICRGPELTAMASKQMYTHFDPAYTWGYQNIVINGPCGPIVI